MVDVKSDGKVTAGTEIKVAIPVSGQSAGQPKKKPRDKVYTTLPAFLIEAMRKHGAPIQVEELIPIVLANISALRKSDGRKYTCVKTNRVIKSALFSVPAFQQTPEGWVLNDAEAQIYKTKTLRNINHRLGKIDTRRFDVDKACTLLARRVEVEGNQALHRLISTCVDQAKTKDVRKESLGTDLLGLRTGEAVVKSLGAERVAGMCVMYNLLRTSKAMTKVYLLPNEEVNRRKLSNLSLGMLYLEQKLRNEIKDISSQK